MVASEEEGCDKSSVPDTREEKRRRNGDMSFISRDSLGFLSRYFSLCTDGCQQVQFNDTVPLNQVTKYRENFTEYLAKTCISESSIEKRGISHIS